MVWNGDVALSFSGKSHSAEKARDISITLCRRRLAIEGKQTVWREAILSRTVTSEVTSLWQEGDRKVGVLQN